MKKMFAGRTLGAVAALTVSATALMTAPAWASEQPTISNAPVPASTQASQGCNGDICISLSTPSGGKVSIKAWAYTSNFKGFFEFDGPNGYIKSSPTETWTAGGTGYTISITAVVGQYCISGIAIESNGGEVDNGYPCESVE
jgi:hypothetical protein